MVILGAVDVLTASAVLATLGVCLTVQWDWLPVVNDAGIPRAVPTSMAVLLAFVAVAVRLRVGIVFRFLACYWGLGAVCFARPALMGIGVDIRLEPLVGAMAVVLFLADSTQASSLRIRRALLTAGALPVVVGAVLLFPASRMLDTSVYAVIAVVALLSVAVARHGEHVRWKFT